MTNRATPLVTTSAAARLSSAAGVALFCWCLARRAVGGWTQLPSFLESGLIVVTLTALIGAAPFMKMWRRENAAAQRSFEAWLLAGIALVVGLLFSDWSHPGAMGLALGYAAVTWAIWAMSIPDHRSTTAASSPVAPTPFAAQSAVTEPGTFVLHSPGPCEQAPTDEEVPSQLDRCDAPISAKGLYVGDDEECDDVSSDAPKAGLIAACVRSRVDDRDLARGEIAETFAAGQRELTTHLVFHPPFTTTPEIEAEDLGEGDLEIQVAAAFRHGARLSIRRPAGPLPIRPVRIGYEAASDRAA